MFKQLFILLFLCGICCVVQQTKAQNSHKLAFKNIYDLEYVSSPQISPDGSRIVYQRHFADIMTDRWYSNLWIINSDGSRHRPLTSGKNSVGSALWSPDGERLLYTSGKSGSTQLYIRWMDTGLTAKITNLPRSPSDLAWSPNGEYIAFTMFMPKEEPPMISLPDKPEGADWAPPAIVIDQLRYRSDGLSGFIPEGYRQVFIIPSEGGTPYQLTFGSYDNSNPVWTPDGEHLIITSNRQEDWKYQVRDSELYKLSVDTGHLTQLTKRFGPDHSPVISPDGTKIAYLGYDDHHDAFEITNLYVMNMDGSNKRLLTENFARSVGNIQWAGDGSGLYFQYANEGNGKISFISLSGEVQKVAGNVDSGIGRPYGGGSYTVASNGTIAYTLGTSSHPADVAVVTKSSDPRRLTRVNKDLLSHINLGEAEEFWFKSSYDGLKIQGWIIKPPNFDPDKKYPLILEIHGGPYSSYGNHFTAQLQLMAAAGYVVVYVNPRGSTSYGKEFAMYIDENYPSHDYNDLMSAVDAVIDRGYVYADSLYVTGGSGGGVLTAWIVGKTDRFNAAVSAKPVINWYSWALTADMGLTGIKYWSPGYPWEHPDWYMTHSPISLVGNVNTPTMLITGAEDYRTPMPGTEQYYRALQYQKIESVMVRIPGASHHLNARPSNAIRKVAYILKWFEMH